MARLDIPYRLLEQVQAVVAAWRTGEQKNGRERREWT
jgi:hypothetical protein